MLKRKVKLAHHRIDRLALAVQDFADTVAEISERHQMSAVARLSFKEARRWERLEREAKCLSETAEEVLHDPEFGFRS